MIDDDCVWVIWFDFELGVEMGWYWYGYDYVIIVLMDCEMLLEEFGGIVCIVSVGVGIVYCCFEGVEYNVINGGDIFMFFVEVELK